MSYLMVYTQPFTSLTHFAYSSILLRTYTNPPECGVNDEGIMCKAQLSVKGFLATTK